MSYSDSSLEAKSLDEADEVASDFGESEDNSMGEEDEEEVMRRKEMRMMLTKMRTRTRKEKTLTSRAWA